MLLADDEPNGQVEDGVFVAFLDEVVIDQVDERDAGVSAVRGWVLREQGDQPLRHYHRQHYLVSLQREVDRWAVVLQQHLAQRYR